MAPQSTEAIVWFTDEGQRDNGIAKLEGLVVKKHYTLRAKVAQAKEDPYVAFHQNHEQEEAEDDSSVPPLERIADRVAPYRSKPYAEQLQLKSSWLEGIIDELGKKLKSEDLQWVWRRFKENKRVCDVLPCVASPVETSYRSKCEFTVGEDPAGMPNTVGFTLGSYAQGSVAVAEPTLVPLVPENVKEVAAGMQAYLRSSPWPAFNRVTHHGVSRTLLVRTTTTKETMALLWIQDTELGPGAIEEGCASLKAFWDSKAAERQQPLLHHLLIQVDNSRSGVDIANRAPPISVFGDPKGIITETLSGLKFKVSPDAFFQPNVLCAERLFGIAREWAGMKEGVRDSELTLLDICCGTGTIGQVMASSVHSVLGFEIVADAVRDAEENAKLNGIENVKYFVGKVEETLDGALRGLPTSRVVGIVDPPRAGLHVNVVKTMRKCKKLERLVYIACNFKASQQNIFEFVGRLMMDVLLDHHPFHSLCRPAGKTYKGDPFTLLKAVPVDMFPQTDHCEVVLLLARGAELASLQKEQEGGEAAAAASGDVGGESGGAEGGSSAV